MSEMVERVARAMALADLDEETRAVVNIDAHMAHVRGHYSELARAAIEAMREPGALMLEAAKKAEYQRYAKPGESMSTTNAQMIRLHYSAMIDAALTE